MSAPDFTLTDEGGHAKPAVTLLAPDGSEASARWGEDFADRASEDEIAEAAGRVGPRAAEPKPPRARLPQPGVRRQLDSMRAVPCSMRALTTSTRLPRCPATQRSA